MPVIKVFLTEDGGLSTPNFFFVRQLLEPYEGRELREQALLAVDSAKIFPSRRSRKGFWYITAVTHSGSREVEVLDHTSDEGALPEMTYSCAREYAERLANEHSVEFIDMTRRGRSGLEA